VRKKFSHLRKIKQFRHVSTFVVVQLLVFFTLTMLMFFSALLPLMKLFSFHRMKALGKSLLMLDENLRWLLLHKALLVTVQKDAVRLLLLLVLKKNIRLKKS
jgi:hypothetical protein